MSKEKETDHAHVEEVSVTVEGEGRKEKEHDLPNWRVTAKMDVVGREVLECERKRGEPEARE